MTNLTWRDDNCDLEATAGELTFRVHDRYGTAHLFFDHEGKRRPAGYSRLSDERQRKMKMRALAEQMRRGDPEAWRQVLSYAEAALAGKRREMNIAANEVEDLTALCFRAIREKGIW